MKQYTEEELNELRNKNNWLWSDFSNDLENEVTYTKEDLDKMVDDKIVLERTANRLMALGVV